LPQHCIAGLSVRVGFEDARNDADASHPLALLRPRRERPGCRAAEQRDELPPLHSITSSARASKVAGTSRPTTFAAVRLITSSNFVGNSTGRSPGFVPFKILSTKAAVRRQLSRNSTP